MKKNNNKGFTLVELIVVLVILAILAAILVPALLGYIDKAREKQVITNAEAAYVAAQAIMTEQYGLNKSAATAQAQVTPANIKALTDITESFTVSPTYLAGSGKHAGFVITDFVYTQTSGQKLSVKRDGTTGEWTRQ